MECGDEGVVRWYWGEVEIVVLVNEGVYGGERGVVLLGMEEIGTKVRGADVGMC